MMKAQSFLTSNRDSLKFEKLYYKKLEICILKAQSDVTKLIIKTRLLCCNFLHYFIVTRTKQNRFFATLLTALH